MGEIPLAREESQERSTLLRDVVADRPSQHRIAGLERLEDRRLRDLTLDVQRYLAVDVRQRPQVRREGHTNHRRGCTSPDNNGGKAPAMGSQPFPPPAPR